jgi:hypothetical protein
MAKVKKGMYWAKLKGGRFSGKVVCNRNPSNQMTIFDLKTYRLDDGELGYEKGEHHYNFSGRMDKFGRQIYNFTCKN